MGSVDRRHVPAAPHFCQWSSPALCCLNHCLSPNSPLPWEQCSAKHPTAQICLRNTSFHFERMPSPFKSRKKKNLKSDCTCLIFTYLHMFVPESLHIDGLSQNSQHFQVPPLHIQAVSSDFHVVRGLEVECSQVAENLLPQRSVCAVLDNTQAN